MNYDCYTAYEVVHILITGWWTISNILPGNFVGLKDSMNLTYFYVIRLCRFVSIIPTKIYNHANYLLNIMQYWCLQKFSSLYMQKTLVETWHKRDVTFNDFSCHFRWRHLPFSCWERKIFEFLYQMVSRYCSSSHWHLFCCTSFDQNT